CQPHSRGPKVIGYRLRQRNCASYGAPRRGRQRDAERKPESVGVSRAVVATTQRGWSPQPVTDTVPCLRDSSYQERGPTAVGYRGPQCTRKGAEKDPTAPLCPRSFLSRSRR